MKLVFYYKQSAVVLIFTLLFMARNCYAQSASNIKKDSLPAFDIRSKSFLLPQPLPRGKYYQALSLQYVVVPKDWTTETVTAPMFGYSGKYTLPYGFNLQGGLSTLIISYRLNLGPFWNYTVNNFHFGAGYQVAFNYGLLNHFGFTTHLTVWEQQPSLTVGYSFKEMAVILRGDMYITSSLHETQAGYTISYPSFTNGYSFSGTLEQRLWKDHLLSFGVKMNYLKYHLIAWPAFPVNQYRYWIPEFDLGLSF